MRVVSLLHHWGSLSRSSLCVHSCLLPRWSLE